MTELKDFRINIEWRHCSCGRWFAYESVFTFYECPGCNESRIARMNAQAAKAEASNRALRGVITRLKRSKHC
jgi:predicted RNA-binding Zn-ribbon protein involved in translation (DUF1610 family)